MLERLLARKLTQIALDHAEKKDQEFIENFTIEQPEESVVFKGYEYQYLENIAAATRMRKTSPSVYNRVAASYTLFYDDCIYLNNYKKDGLKITYQQLAECKNSGNLKYNPGRGIVTLKMNKSKYLMYVCGADKDRVKEQEITGQIAAFLQNKCGVKIV